MIFISIKVNVIENLVLLVRFESIGDQFVRENRLSEERERDSLVASFLFGLILSVSLQQPKSLLSK